MLRPTGLRGLRVGRQGQRGYQAQLGFRQRSAGSERGLVVFQSQYSSSDSGSVDSGGGFERLLLMQHEAESVGDRH